MTMTQEEREKLKADMLRLYDLGLSIPDIIKTLGIKTATGYFYADQLGFRRKNYSRFSDAEKTQIAKLYNLGFRPKDIAEKIGTTTKQIQNYIANHFKDIEKVAAEPTDEDMLNVERVKDTRKAYKVELYGKKYVDVTEFYT